MPRNVDRRAPEGVSLPGGEGTGSPPVKRPDHKKDDQQKKRLRAALAPRPPVELSETERELLARAVCLTRVSHFTREERSKLVTLVLRLGYRIEGGL